ncbi:MAG: succinate-semialdehyde dehydrogenase [Spirochaetes bacterium RBG_16_49_21]|nr:MAG: succinate-semialdehyde dehydrogenase [Spirochaetes bacterium RBG_16_49_21]
MRRQRRKPDRRASGGKTVYYDPATGKELGRVRNTDLSTIRTLMADARKAQTEWASLPFRERKRHILKIRDYIVEHSDEIARVISENSGKTRIDALATEVIPSALAAEWYAKNAEKYLKRENLPSSSILFSNKRNVIERQPLGVVGIISPWNYPFSIPFGEIIMGIMAGNAIMVKVSAATTMVGLEIEKIMKKGDLPDGLFHLLIGSGDDIASAMLENGIDKIFFTGSTATGSRVMQKAARHITPVSLELGGKDAMIVLSDADLERTANGAAWAGYQNAGQSCGAVERLYVHESVYDRFMELLSEKTRALRFGRDRDFNVEMGSMTTREQWETVNRHVESALRKGARIAAQSDRGKKVRGSFYPPILLADVDHSMEIMREETFGPVIPVMKFKTEEEAVRLANDSSMGLTASIWTRNVKLAKKIGLRLQAGVITINDHLYTHGQPETPWGGWKNSGIGFTHSRLGLMEMTRAKLINWDMLPSRRNIWWFPYDRKTYEGLKAALRFAFPKSAGDIVLGGIRLIAFMTRKMFTRWKTR